MQDRISSLLRFLDEDPEDAFLLFALAREYAEAGEQDKAQEFYLRLLDKHPDYVAVYYHLGKFYASAGRTGEALDLFTKGMQVAQDQGDQHSLMEMKGALDTLESGQ